MSAHFHDGSQPAPAGATNPEKRRVVAETEEQRYQDRRDS